MTTLVIFKRKITTTVFLSLLFLVVTAAENRSENPLAIDSLNRLNDLAEDFSDQGLVDSLEKYSKITYDIAKRENDYQHVLEAANRLAIIYENQGDLRRALQL